MKTDEEEIKPGAGFEPADPSEEKMFGLLKTRNIGVTKMNLLSMWFLQFTSVLAFFWTMLY